MRKKPISIGRLAIFFDYDDKKFDIRYFTDPYRGKDCKEFWDDWGTYNLYLTFFNKKVLFEYSHGKKIKNIIKHYMY